MGANANLQRVSSAGRARGRWVARRVGGAVLAGMAVVVAVATPVLAHDPLISGQVRCAENDKQVITWTLTHDTVLDRSMVIKAIELTRGSLVGFSVGQKLPPPPAPGSTVTGNTTLPGDALGTVTLRVTGGWVDQNGNPAGPQAEQQSATVNLVGTCVSAGNPAVTPAANPAATITPSCVDGGALVTVRNTGGTATTFTILKGSTAVDTIQVPAGGSVSRTYPMTEGETASFRATAPGGFDTGAVPITFSCAAPASPSATIVPSCVDGGALVTLTNTGGKAAVFTVLKDGSAVDQVEVAPGGSVRRTYPMSEDQTSSFRATAAGFDTGAVAVTFDCVAQTQTQVAGVLIEKAPVPGPAPAQAQAQAQAPAPGPAQAQAQAPAPARAPAPAQVASVSASRSASVAAADVDQLPRTGSGTSVLLGVGVVFVGLGVIFTRASRPPARRAVSAV